MELRDGLLLGAVLVALFGPIAWRFLGSFLNNRKIKKEIHAILKKHLEQLRFDLLRIRDKRNKGRTEATDRIRFNRVSISEVEGYYFLFSDLLLRELDHLKLSKYPATIDFFIHYKINIETIRKRTSDDGGTGFLTLATFNKLLEYLENAIKEFK